MYRIGIVNLEKTEVLKELTNEFLMPKDYVFESISLDDFNELSSSEIDSFDILINSSNLQIPIEINKIHAREDNKNLDLNDLSSTEKTELVKRELYFALVKLTGYEPLWGTLTGVRPVKLAGELIEKLGEDETYHLLRNYYLISEEKTRLVIDIYNYQVETLGKPKDNSVSIYVGIPFCPTRCLYCSFASNQVPKNEIERYIPALIHEIEEVALMTKERGYEIESIYMGGGTPTTLDSEEMDKLLSAINQNFSLNDVIEFTVEAGRPDTIDREKLLVLKNHGVDRISINPQSMKERTLELIGRSHTPQDIERAFSDALSVGFNSINCDLIAGLPEEDISDFEFSLNKVLDMGADNITIHNLAVKRASRLNEQDPEYHYRQGKLTLSMIESADSILKSKGFKPYYLYRQKHMAGSGENTGYTLPGKEGLYNTRIMDEHQTIIALGAGGITKYYHPKENRLERVPNVTNYEQYIERIDEMIGRKKNAY